MRPCVSCATPLEEASRFCPSCGAPQAAGATPTQTPTLVSDRSEIGSSGPGTSSGRRSRFLPGEIVAGRYRVEGMLGKGGMGEVYRAEDLKLGQDVALKFLPASLAQHPSMLARFHNEVRLARQVTHRNVCRVHDIGDVDGQPFITMEFVDGENLASLLRRIGRLPADKAVDIARQLCAGLAAAHDRGVLHRDLKPENVMLDGRGTVRIMDFGLAGVREDVAADDLRSGTPAYMAPEQLEGRGVTIRSDIYALGLVLSEMFTGRRVFDAPTLDDLRRQRDTFVPERSAVSGADVDPAVERVIRRCLEKEPEKRPASALSVALALPGGDPLRAALAAGEVPSPEMVAAAGGEVAMRRGLAWGLAAGAVAVVALLGALIPRASVLGWVRLDRSAEAMAERAREALQIAGYRDPPVTAAWGYEEGDGVIEWLQGRGTPADRWAPLGSGRMGALTFWYRQAPRVIRPGNMMGRITSSEPDPGRTSGDAVVFLDEKGRLVGLRITPAQELPPEAAGAVAWSKLFEAAGLDLAAFAPVEPRWAPPVWADALVAWKGRLPELPDVEVRVEASSARGRVATFEVVRPWSRASRAAPSPASVASRVVATANVVLLLGAIGSAAWLTRRNLAAGRADRRGAWRLAAWAFVVTLGQWACFASHTSDGAQEWTLIVRGTAFALFIASFAALLYLAVEPVVRRIWPDALISWTRLLAGRWRDPLVGRDALVGISVSAALTLVVVASLLVQSWLGAPSRPRVPDMDGTLGAGSWLGQMLSVQINPLITPMVFLLALVGLRALFKTTARALSVAVGVLGVIFALAAVTQKGPSGWVLAGLGFVQIAALLWIIVRFGVFAGVAATLTASTINAFPLPATDPGAWYAPYGVAALVAIAAGAAVSAANASRRIAAHEAGGP